MKLVEIKGKIKDKNLYLIIDASPMNKKNYINILVGSLTYPKTSYLVDSFVATEALDHTYAIGIIADSINNLGIERSKFALLITDAASYFTRATPILYSLFPKLTHITCLLHLLHNCAMLVRTHYKATDRMIADVQMSLCKSTERRTSFCTLGLPPKVVITRWGYWLKTAIWYSENFLECKRIVNEYTPDGIIVRKAKESINNPEVFREVTEIRANYKVINDLIDMWTTNRPLINDSVRTLRSLEFPNDMARVKDYIGKRLNKNDILRIVNWKNQPVERDPRLISDLLISQASSIDVERSFSILNNLLTNKRNFNDENVRHYMISKYNK